MSQFTNKEITDRLNILNSSSAVYTPIGRQLATIPTTDVSGNNGDFFYDVSTMYFKSNDVWTKWGGASNAF